MSGVKFHQAIFGFFTLIQINLHAINLIRLKQSLTLSSENAMKRRDFILTSGATAVLSACGGGNSGNDNTPVPNVVVIWNQTALEAVRVVKPGPPMVARALAILHTAMYDAWSAYNVAAQPTIAPSQRRPPEEQTNYNKIRAMSYAAIRVLNDLYPTEKAAFEAQMKTLGFALSTRIDSVTPDGIGNTAAQRVIDFRRTDGSNQSGSLSTSGVPYADYASAEYPLYTPSNPAASFTTSTPLSGIPAPDHWQQLTYFDTTGVTRTPAYIGPFWGRVTPFALTSRSQFRPTPPQALNSPGFRAQAAEVVAIQQALTDKEKVIAEYWADGPASELPPGHWGLFGQFVAARDKQTNDQSVQMFFALSNAIFDASIAVWEAKRFYDYCRPITAIRFLYNGQTVKSYGSDGPAAGLVDVPGEAWRTFQIASFPTPPFPEYVSGHSGFSAAGAEVLKRFTGSDTFGASHTQPARSLRVDASVPAAPVTLNWPTFTDAANEAGMSRLLGGIHFMEGNTAGLALGRSVGANAYAKAQRLWSGQTA
ncbi:MAG: hypothetical protein RL748_3674 [Pseudomonadota bacterium]|jgi:hypothetical protein